MISFENVENKKNISKIAYFRLFNSLSAVENPSKTASKGLFGALWKENLPCGGFQQGMWKSFPHFVHSFSEAFPTTFQAVAAASTKGTVGL
jgi:hypothetical protein